MHHCRLVAPAVWLGCFVACLQPAAVIAQEKPPETPAKELYAEQPDEKFAPADPRLPNTVRRARADDAIYKLSNPREGQVKVEKGGMRNGILIDYEVVRLGKFEGGEIVVHTSDGQRLNVHVNFESREHGTLQLVVAGKTPKSSTAALPKNAEFYVVRTDSRFGPKAPTFKVSNSVVLGKMTVLTKARDWTAQEIAAYKKGPPAYTQPNIHQDIGEDTSFAGAPPGGNMLRYVDPKAALLGLEYRLGEWAGEKCIGGLVPIFEPNQESLIPGGKREVAKKGYAVAGAEVHSTKNVDGIKLIYAKVQADGSLDLKDSYTGALLGYKGATSQVLAKDGRKVLGINLRQGAVVDGLALVAEKK
jgi:hypothetical protein